MSKLEMDPLYALPKIYRNVPYKPATINVVTSAKHRSDPKSHHLKLEVAVDRLREIGNHLADFNRSGMEVSDLVRMATDVCRALEVNLEFIKGMQGVDHIAFKDTPKEAYMDGYSRVALLSPTQFEYIKLIAKGYSNKEISDTTGVKASTVNQVLCKAYKKLNVCSRMQAVALCKKLGFIKDEN
jgi:DNA-binding CsgD family transcriptional regulator